MTHFALARNQASVLRSFRSTRFYTGPTVDFEHFASGWKNVEDIEEFTKHGTYQLQTFNKISPQV